MTANGERRDGRPYEDGPHADGTGYRPDSRPDPAGETQVGEIQAGQMPVGQYGTYDQGQGTGYSQGYAPQQQDPAYGYGYEGQGQSYGGGQSYPGPYETPAYETPAYEAPGYDGRGYQTPSYGSPSYESPSYDSSSHSYGVGADPAYGTQPSYETPEYGYRTPSYGSPAYGDSGQDHDSGAYPAPGYSGSGQYGGQTGYDSGAYPAAQPGMGGSVPAPSVDYDSGAYAAYDGRNYPQGSGAGPASGTASAPAEPRVRRIGSTGSTGSAGASSTTGSFRVRVPQPAPAEPGRPSAGRTPAEPGTPAAPSAPSRPPGAPIPGQQRSGARPPGAPGGPAGRTAADRERVGYAADEFDFVDDDAEESEDVIDWLKFAETRSERRDERRRRLRSKALVMLVVMAVVGVAVGGYFAYDKWFAADSKAGAKASGGAVLMQLRGAQGEATASAVLAGHPARGTATMITVPSNTVVNTAGAGPMALGELMATDGAGASREALAQLIGVKLDGSWVVSEPVLQGLVDMVGGVELNADAEVKGPDGKVLVPAGPSKVNGIAARAYATYRIPGEKSALGAERFGRVMVAVLGALPTDAKLVADLLRNLANVADPSLPDQRLAELLTSMAKAVQGKRFKSADLPLQADGVINVAAAGPVVKDLLGGSVQVAKAEGPARVMVSDASGKAGAQEAARIKMVNAGYSYVPGGVVEAKSKPVSAIQFTDDRRRDAAVQVALTLGLPESTVQKVEGQMLADIVVTLGQDFTP